MSRLKRLHPICSEKWHDDGSIPGGVFKGLTANSCLHFQLLIQNYRLGSPKSGSVGQDHQNKPLESWLSGIMREISLSVRGFIRSILNVLVIHNHALT